MHIFGGDLATTSGLAILDIGQQTPRLVHAEQFRPRGDNDAQIFAGFRVHLRAMLVTFNVKAAAIEQPLVTELSSRGTKIGEDGKPESRRNPTTMAVYLRLYGLRSHAVEMFHSMGIPFDEVNQSSWRKAFVGNGRADKKDSQRLCKVLGYGDQPHNAAEAIGVAWWLAGQVNLRKSDMFPDTVAKLPK